MTPFSTSDSVRRLLDSVRKLENTLKSVGLPRFLSRLPVCWLCWHYCRMLDDKIQRMDKVESKFRKWLPMVRNMSREGPGRTELIDVDHSMRTDISVTRNTLWELHSYCLDVASMFDQLGYRSPGLQKRTRRLVKVLEHACVGASTLIEAVAEHDRQALSLLQAEQLRERALPPA